MNADSRVADVLSGAARGAVGAMAMTGMRVITSEIGLVEQTLRRPSAASVRAAYALASGEPRASGAGG
jgi:hypothetical protein